MTDEQQQIKEEIRFIKRHPFDNEALEAWKMAKQHEDAIMRIRKASRLPFSQDSEEMPIRGSDKVKLDKSNKGKYLPTVIRSTKVNLQSESAPTKTKKN